MKVYAQFYHNSTGYINGSCPPEFSKENIKPIPMCGSNGVFILDGRNNLSTMVMDSTNRELKLGNNIRGFKIIRAERFTDKGQILYSSF